MELAHRSEEVGQRDLTPKSLYIAKRVLIQIVQVVKRFTYTECYS